MPLPPHHLYSSHKLYSAHHIAPFANRFFCLLCFVFFIQYLLPLTHRVISGPGSPTPSLYHMIIVVDNPKFVAGVTHFIPNCESNNTRNSSSDYIHYIFFSSLAPSSDVDLLQGLTPFTTLYYFCFASGEAYTTNMLTSVFSQFLAVTFTDGSLLAIAIPVYISLAHASLFLFLSPCRFSCISTSAIRYIVK